MCTTPCEDLVTIGNGLLNKIGGRECMFSGLHLNLSISSFLKGDITQGNKLKKMSHIFC